MIIFLFGPETYRGHQKITEFKNKFIKEIDVRGDNIEEIDGEISDLNEINHKISSCSLLASKRMIILKNVFNNKSKGFLKELKDYFLGKKEKSDSNDGNIIIFWETSIKSKKSAYKESIVKIDNSGRDKVLNKEQNDFFNFLRLQKFVQEFKELSNTEAATWLKQQAEKKGAKISLSAGQLLVGLIGNDLWALNNEIDKLINFCQGKKDSSSSADIALEIKEDDVRNLSRGSFDQNIFALGDAISNKNKIEALRLLEEQYQAGLSDPYLMNMIIRQFKILIQVRQALDLGDSPKKIMANLKLHPFVVQKSQSQARFFSLLELKKIFSHLLKLDSLSKQGQADIKLELNLMFSRL